MNKSKIERFTVNGMKVLTLILFFFGIALITYGVFWQGRDEIISGFIAFVASVFIAGLMSRNGIK